nr:DUF4354 family protein [Pseudomonas aeruginosa]
MKNAMALTLAGLLAAPSLGFAAAPDAVMVFARQGDKGSVSVGDKHFRTQAFKVRLVNAAKSEISLKNSCLVAQSAAGYRGRGTHRRDPQAGGHRRRRRDLRLRRRRGVRRIAGQAERPVQVGD